MKKMLFVLGLMALTLNLKAQNFKYLDSTCEWRHFVLGGSPVNCMLVTKYFDGDTIIGTKVYFKVYEKVRFLVPATFPNPTSFTYLPDTNNANLSYYQREDSLHNFIGYNWYNQEAIMYNFDSLLHLNINDSFPKNSALYPHPCLPYDGYFANCPITKKDTFYLGTQMLLGYETNSAFTHGYIGIVEGVGSAYPFLCNFQQCPDAPNNQLVFYKKYNDTLKFFNVIPYDSFPKIVRLNRYNYLPLKLLSFNARQETRNVVLNWQTANEVNVSHINIQRGVNGKDFTSIGKVNTSCCEYIYTDNQLPITNDKLTLYYRLEIVDKDGSKTYSSIQPITINAKLSTLNIYPNPSNGIVTIECAGAKELLIIDYLGREISRYTRNDVNVQHQTINTKQLPKGIYVVKAIMNNGDVKTEKLVVE